MQAATKTHEWGWYILDFGRHCYFAARTCGGTDDTLLRLKGTRSIETDPVLANTKNMLHICSARRGI